MINTKRVLSIVGIAVGLWAVIVMTAMQLGPQKLHDAKVLAGARAQNAVSDRFQPQRLMGPLPPSTDFPNKDAQAVANDLLPNETVLGVTVNGASRAYPINMLTGPSREILNDTLGGRPIAATW